MLLTDKSRCAPFKSFLTALKPFTNAVPAPEIIIIIIIIAIIVMIIVIIIIIIIIIVPCYFLSFLYSTVKNVVCIIYILI